MSELDDVFRNDCRTCGALRGEWCAEWCPSNMDYEPAHELAGALVVLGHAIARFVRRATVADLVEQIRQIHDGDCSWWEDAACDCSIRGHLTALSRLARLAGGGA